MRIIASVYLELLSAFPPVPPEAGGILGSGDGGLTVTHFIYDAGTPFPDRAVYVPNIPMLNEIIRSLAAKGVRFCGMVHSHPPAQKTLSNDDKAYMRQIMRSMPDDVNKLYFPLVIPNAAVIPFSMRRRNGAITEENLEVIAFARGGGS